MWIKGSLLYSQTMLLLTDNWERCALLCNQIALNASSQTQIFTDMDEEGEKGKQ